MLLDIELPRMDGLTFLRKIMSQRPIPVVICSSLAEAGSDTLMQALEAGAVDVVTKPRVDTAQFLLVLLRAGTRYTVNIIDGPHVSRHRPSVDVLFRSASQVAGRNAMGVILTGMGDDGARGLLKMRQAGSHTLAQDEESCIVFGMPKEAIQRGAAVKIVPLSRVATEIGAYARTAIRLGA